MYTFHRIDGLDDIRNQVQPIPPVFAEKLGVEAIPGWLSYTEPLGLNNMGAGFMEYPAGQGQSFTHSHNAHEELYFVIAGSGEIWIDGEVSPLSEGTAVKVDPEHVRALRNTGDGPLRVFVVSASAGEYSGGDGNPNFDQNPWAEA